MLVYEITNDEEADYDELYAITSNLPLPRKLKRIRDAGPVTRYEERQLIAQKVYAHTQMQHIYTLFANFIKAVENMGETFPDDIFQDVHEVILNPLAKKLKDAKS